jgi:DNA helicase-2/ATP-dependent DNA helicase PcrA
MESKISSITNIIKNLNKEQLDVVVNTKNNIRIIAGPGSGKTRTITSKIAYLISKEKIQSHRILAVTFTNKAAKEMKNRVIELIGQNQTRVFTFHGFCANVLYREAENTRYGSDFHILDRKDQEHILRQLYKKRNLSPRVMKYSDVLKKFSDYNNNNLKIEDLKKDFKDSDLEQVYIELYEEYIEEKVKSKALDFNDLLTEVLTVFENKELAKK